MQALPDHTNLWNRRNVTLCLVIGLCLVPMLIPVFTVLYAADSAVSTTVRNDADGDLIVNTADVDDDNDGIPDLLEITADGLDRDSDNDGMPDRLDLDSDNDSILDWVESGAIKTISLASLRTFGGRLIGEVGANGMLDIFESPKDTGQLAYTLSNTDRGQDDIPDFLDLDTDNDGWPDLREAGVSAAYDTDHDGRIDVLRGNVGNDGIADYLQQINDQACCDLDGDGSDDIIPLNSDFTDLPDFQDLDSDNDGLSDIVELGGEDSDQDGRIDNFLDVAGTPDGMDDGLMAFPYRTTDANGNGVPDHRDFVAPTSAGSVTGEDPDGEQPQNGGELLDDGTGVVRTGLNASGCSIASVQTDFLLLLLPILGISVLCWRCNAASSVQMPKKESV